MSESDSCGECETVAEKYKRYLENETRALLSFRGHGNGPKKLKYSSHKSFSTTEWKKFFKLILLGCGKLHYVQTRDPVDISMGGFKISSKIQKIEERFEASIEMSLDVPFDISEKATDETDVFIFLNIGNNKIYRRNLRFNDLETIIELPEPVEKVSWDFMFEPIEATCALPE